MKSDNVINSILQQTLAPKRACRRRGGVASSVVEKTKSKSRARTSKATSEPSTFQVSLRIAACAEKRLILTLKQFAELTGTSTHAVYRALEAGKFEDTAVKLTGRWLCLNPIYVEIADSSSGRAETSQCPDLPPFMGIEEVAVLLQLSPAIVRRLSREGVLRGEIPGLQRFKTTAVLGGLFPCFAPTRKEAIHAS